MESKADGLVVFNEGIIFRGIGRIKGEMGFLSPRN